MNILLIDPSIGTGDGLNTGLGWLSASVENSGHKARVLDLVNRPYMETEDTVNFIRKTIDYLNPDLIGFCIHSITMKKTQELVLELRKFYAKPILIGGPQMAFERKEIFHKIPNADFAFVGESEESLPDFMNMMERGHQNFENISSMIWKKNGDIIENEQRGVKKDITNMPYPDYRRHFGLLKMKTPYSLMTSRGCPFSCIFCNSEMSGKKWRLRPLDNVIQELKEAVEKYGISEFMIQEPVFNLKPERVIEFCHKLKEHNIDMPWFSPSGMRADRLTPEVLTALKKSGCKEIKVGVETLVPEIFKNVNKGTTIEKLVNACKMIRNSDFSLRGSFIIGLPEDTYETTMKNYELSRELDFATTDWSLLIPYPGTQAYEWVKKHGNIFYDYCSADQGAFQVNKPEDIKLAFDTPEFPAEARIKAFVKISVKSHNYIFDRNAGKLKKITTLLKQVIKEDPFNFFSHLKVLYSRMKAQDERGASRSDRYIFEELKSF